MRGGDDESRAIRKTLEEAARALDHASETLEALTAAQVVPTRLHKNGIRLLGLLLQVEILDTKDILHLLEAAL